MVQCPFTEITIPGRHVPLKISNNTVFVVTASGGKKQPVKWTAGLSEDAFRQKIIQKMAEGVAGASGA